MPTLFHTTQWGFLPLPFLLQHVTYLKYPIPVLLLSGNAIKQEMCTKAYERMICQLPLQTFFQLMITFQNTVCLSCKTSLMNVPHSFPFAKVVVGKSCYVVRCTQASKKFTFIKKTMFDSYLSSSQSFCSIKISIPYTTSFTVQILCSFHKFQ